MLGVRGRCQSRHAALVVPVTDAVASLIVVLFLCLHHVLLRSTTIVVLITVVRPLAEVDGQVASIDAAKLLVRRWHEHETLNVLLRDLMISAAIVHTLLVVSGVRVAYHTTSAPIVGYDLLCRECVA